MEKKKKHWVFKERFSWFDLIPIFIFAEVFSWALHHLHWS